MVPERGHRTDFIGRRFMWTWQSSLRAANQIRATHVRGQGWLWRAGCMPTARPAKRHVLTRVADWDSDSVSGRTIGPMTDLAVRMFQIEDSLPATSGVRRQRPYGAVPVTIDKHSAEGCGMAWARSFAPLHATIRKPRDTSSASSCPEPSSRRRSSR